MSNALASLSRLSSSRIVTRRWGIRTSRRTAVAAAASGGATAAPKASAAAQGIAGTSQRATNATAAVVTATATNTRLTTGIQYWRRSRSELSNAASISTGATNKASAKPGSSEIRGGCGRSATHTPTSANIDGDGTL